MGINKQNLFNQENHTNLSFFSIFISIFRCMHVCGVLNNCSHSFFFTYIAGIVIAYHALTSHHITSHTISFFWNLLLWLLLLVCARNFRVIFSYKYFHCKEKERIEKNIYLYFPFTIFYNVWKLNRRSQTWWWVLV